MLTFRGFVEDACFEKGSALTFWSLMTIVPLLAIVFGIAQSFGIEQLISEEVKNQLKSQPEIAEKIVQFSQSYLKETRGGLIASLGIIALIWTTFSMSGSIESYFNKIWKISKSRTFWQQIKRYAVFILVLPLFLVLSSSITIYSVTVADAASGSVYFSSVVYFVIKVIPYFLTWGMLSFFYFYFPNTKVLWTSSLVAGIITCLIFSIWQWIYVQFQVHATSYGVIYGSFAAIPFFLFWLNYSWLIILFGTELSYQTQKALTDESQA